jgi:hypothetical protein
VSAEDLFHARHHLGTRRDHGAHMKTRARPTTFSAWVDLERGTRVGAEVVIGAAGSARVLQAAREIARAKRVRVAGRLYVHTPLDAELPSALAKLADGLADDGGASSDLGLVLRATDEAIHASRCARALGFRVVLRGAPSQLVALLDDHADLVATLQIATPSLSRAEPGERAEVLRLGRITRSRGLSLHAAGLDLFEDLVFARQVGVRVGSGSAFGGATVDVPRLTPFHRTLLRLARSRTETPLGVGLETALDHALSARRGLVSGREQARFDAELLAPLVSARRALARASHVALHAERMRRVADRDLTRLLDDLAEGSPTSAEHLDRSVESFLEARALEDHARVNLAAVERTVGALTAAPPAELIKRALASGRGRPEDHRSAPAA